MRRILAALVWLMALGPACGDNRVAPRPCEVTEPEPSLESIDCWQEFEIQATRPLDRSLPGAWTIKTIVDRANGDRLHFLDTQTYPLHQEFAVEHLGWPPGQSFVGEYLFPQRRFLLGSVTYFEGPGIFTYELAPYDSASADMIRTTMVLLARQSYIGEDLYFHPTSEEQRALAAELGDDIRIIDTAELYAGMDYQPLNLTETIAQVRILSVEALEDEYVSPREIAVLDRVPNDISVVAAVVTEQFQTPLSHVNVLSQQRGTPNMALRDARSVFEPFEGKWVRLAVGAFDYSLEEVSAAEAEAWWQDHRPEPVVVSPPDLTALGLPSLDDVGLDDLAAVGGKAAHYGELRDIDGLNVRPGFVVPVFYYRQFLEQNALDDSIAAMLADPAFSSDGVLRRQRLEELQEAIRAAPVDTDLLAAVEAKILGEFAGERMRFRSSTNAEDLNGFSGAGLYSSTGGAVGDPDDSVADAMRHVWASLWNVRAFEEREYVSIDHNQVAMAILVHPSYLDETANGVAITANVFDPAIGGEDGFYLNVQAGEVSVVMPPESGIVADQLLYFFFHNNQPATYFSHSSLVVPGEPVLTRRQLFELGTALDAIRRHFSERYAPPPGYAVMPMDVEFKRLGSGDSAEIFIKQARPYPGRGSL